MIPPRTVPRAAIQGRPDVAAARPAYDRRYVLDLIERIVQECPRRQPTSEDERRAHEIARAELEALGLQAEFQPFTFNDSLYANLALHFGVGVAGSLLSQASPAAALAMHWGAATSYWADSTRRGYLLRRLFRFKESRNLLATRPADRPEPALRIVFLAHADAAFTGWIFEPWLVKNFTAVKYPPSLKFLNRSLALATWSLFALGGIDLVRLVFGRLLTLPLVPLEVLLTVPSLLAFGLNAQMVWRDEVVPGANDNLSAVAALPVLASRLLPRARPDVEYVFAVTGCEEASLGGGDALAHRMEGTWDKRRTVFIGMDMLTNGDLTWLQTEGEVVEVKVPAWLGETAGQVAASDPRFAGVKGFDVPVGGSDMAAFLARGWEGLCLTCVDPALGMPRHYHSPEDTPANLDMDRLMESIDFAEALADAVVARRLGTEA